MHTAFGTENRGTEIQRPLSESQQWLQRALKVIPGAAQTFSKSPMVYVQGIAPNFLSRGNGAYVWDVDGNKYIDMVCGLGPVILGHADPEVNEAVERQMRDGVSFSLPHYIEVEVAELLREIIPCAEMVRFGKNGSDVTAAGVRVARAFTKREKVVRCGYHGWQDWYIGSTSRFLGVPECVRALTLSFPYNNIEALKALFQAHPGEIACVIMEPVTFDSPHTGFLQAVKELCHHNGALLVFDEIVTGFRFRLGGAQEYFGIQPDLCTLGKAMANGFPLAAICGRADVMEYFTQVFFSGTHGGEAASLAACKATVEAMRSRGTIQQIWRRGETLKDRSESIIRSLELQKFVQCVGYPPWTGFRFRDQTGSDSLLVKSIFQQECLKRGLLTLGTNMISGAHDEGVIDQVSAIYEQVFEKLAIALNSPKMEEFLEGAEVQAVMRQ